MRTSARSDTGDSLVELLVAIAILGVSGAGLIGAVLMVSGATAMHTQVGTSDSVLRTWAAHLGTSDYVACARPSDLTTPPEPTGWSGQAPSWKRTIEGVAYEARIDDVGHWDAAAAGFTSSCTSDTGLQRVALSISAPGAGLPGTTGQLVLTRRNPCVTTSQAGCSS